MCDDDGNKVLLKITDNGITITQQKYGQTTVIDPESGKVKTNQSITAFIELTSETVFELPTPRSRTTIGVGESVKVTANTAVTWEINGVDFDKGTETARELTFTARDIAGSITVTAKTECDSESITFNVITPNGLSFSIRDNLKAHKYNTFSALFLAKIRVLPLSVNFGNIQIQELDCKSVDTGIFNTGQDHYHSGNQNSSLCWREGELAQCNLDDGHHYKCLDIFIGGLGEINLYEFWDIDFWINNEHKKSMKEHVHD